MYYMGFTYQDCYNLPISYREWFKRRLIEEIKKSRESGDGSSRAPHENTADQRSLMERGRSQVPSRLTRFT